jgi:hypothetical protein
VAGLEDIKKGMENTAKMVENAAEYEKEGSQQLEDGLGMILRGLELARKGGWMHHLATEQLSMAHAEASTVTAGTNRQDVLQAIGGLAAIAEDTGKQETTLFEFRTIMDEQVRGHAAHQVPESFRAGVQAAQSFAQELSAYGQSL